MQTLGANFKEETTLLIQGIKGKFDEHENLSDPDTNKNLVNFVNAFKALLKKN